MVLRFAESVPFFMVTVFAVSYATGQLGVSRQVMLSVIMICCVIAFPMHGLFGALSDRVGRRPIYNVAHNSINAVQPSFFTELFGPRVRYSGASIGAQLGAIVAGGFTPFIAKGLTAINGNSWTLVAAYVVVVSLISATAAYSGPETSKRSLGENYPC